MTHFARMSMGSVHPHVRGEHGLAAVGIEVAAGSSPRAWGTLVCTTSPSKASRFIPTCVGNTSVSARPGGPWPVHPHVRGEHASNTASSWSPSGSSPRAWGTRPWRWCWTARCRFIPTCVGNTRCRLPRSSRCSVHPHVRGEHAYLVPDADVEDGSSPRAWGTQAAAQVGRSSCRFIPTCVGNTASSVPSRPRRPVHPHVRGEHQAHGQDVLDEGGSSPRAWGTRDAQPHDRRPRRFIPTCVGNTAAASVDAERDDGSSPRAWGTRRC